IENVISALPAILERHPNVVYMVLGATHPHILRENGETYRLWLQSLARQKGVESNVIFYNQFVELEELNQFIGAADIYITPYLEPAQIVSGTLAYTLGAGKAVVSTPYWYAEEMLADDRGVLVPFRNPEALAAGVNDLLDNEAKRHAMRKRAYLYGRQMIWSEVAQRYMETFEHARSERRRSTQGGFAVKPLDKRPAELPPLNLHHLEHMTDDTGILQHATFSIPNYREGYTTDDNARALIVSVLLEESGHKKSIELGSRYLAFLWNAFDLEHKWFRNFMDYQRNWLERRGSEDSQGRSLWALGTVLNRSHIPPLHDLAGRIFEQSLMGILETTSPRAWSFALLGLYEYLQRFEGDRRAHMVQEELAQRLLGLYRQNNSVEWRWFEPSLTYCNATLAHAILLSGSSMADAEMIRTGTDALTWLMDLQRAEAPDGHFVPIGSNGFYPRSAERARFDQQPVEAQATVSACLDAFRITGHKEWQKQARNVFEWFLGKNDLSTPLFDPTTGGCRDGLHPDRPNENQGAESTLSFLQALLELRLAENNIPSGAYSFDEHPTLAALPAPQTQSNTDRR
ncbi:MAG: glycosyltransferase, partial [Anaerolineae bacterium]